MSDKDLAFTGSLSTMVAIALVASVLSLAMNVWNIQRTNQVEAAIVALQMHLSQR